MGKRFLRRYYLSFSDFHQLKIKKEYLDYLASKYFLTNYSIFSFSHFYWFLQQCTTKSRFCFRCCESFFWRIQPSPFRWCFPSEVDILEIKWFLGGGRRSCFKINLVKILSIWWTNNVITMYAFLIYTIFSSIFWMYRIYFLID